jgi:uncharacterized protein
MFGLSLGKILILVAVVAAVWFGYRFLKRMQRVKREESDADERRQMPHGAAGGHAATEAEEMSACPVCGTYLAPRSARSCGRKDCPYTA